MKNNLCPCKSGKQYADCCQPFHLGTFATDALCLMRSRYSAYALRLAGYIIATTHVDNPHFSQNKKKWQEQILQFSRETIFEDLTIVSFDEGLEDAYVTFKAQLKQQGRDVSFTERSYFQRIDGKWLYHSGEILKT